MEGTAFVKFGVVTTYWPDLHAWIQVVIEGMEGGRLVFFPQLLIACLAGLCTSVVHVFSLLLNLLSQVSRL